MKKMGWAYALLLMVLIIWPDYVLAAIAEAQPGTFHLDEEKSHDEYDEKVLVKEAWDEQVIDYYECDCGARKY